jgi:hypothetical protein
VGKHGRQEGAVAWRLRALPRPSPRVALAVGAALSDPRVLPRSVWPREPRAAGVAVVRTLTVSLTAHGLERRPRGGNVASVIWGTLPRDDASCATTLVAELLGRPWGPVVETVAPKLSFGRLVEAGVMDAPYAGHAERPGVEVLTRIELSVPAGRRRDASEFGQRVDTRPAGTVRGDGPRDTRLAFGDIGTACRLVARDESLGGPVCGSSAARHRTRPPAPRVANESHEPRTTRARDDLSCDRVVDLASGAMFVFLTCSVARTARQDSRARLLETARVDAVVVAGAGESPGGQESDDDERRYQRGTAPSRRAHQARRQASTAHKSPSRQACP